MFERNLFSVSFESVLEHQSECAHGEPAGGHLSIRLESVQELAAAGVVRCVADHTGDPDPEYFGARSGIRVESGWR